MPTPYDLYIRFLATTGLEDVEEVNDKLGLLCLPPVDQKTFEAQHTVVFTTLPHAVEQQIARRSFCGDFMQWMKILEVDDLWYLEKEFRGKDQARQSAAKLAYDVNQDRTLRLAMSALLIKAVPPADVVQTLSSRFSILLKEDSAKIYHKYFFAPERMTRKGWREFLAKVDEQDAKIYFTALSEPLDVLKTELELPAKISTSESLQWLLTKSYLKAKQYMETNTPEGNKEARYWIDTVIQLVDKYEKYRSSDASDFSNALQLEFEFVDQEFDIPDVDTVREIQAKLRSDETLGTSSATP